MISSSSRIYRRRSIIVNKNKIILDLCGGTGAWSDPYKQAGYDVRIISLPYYPLFEKIPGDVRIYEPPPEVYGILAAPPCEEFSFAKVNLKSPRNIQKGLEIVKACLDIIWKCQLSHWLKFWALENPRGYLRRFLGIASYSFEHWEFNINLKKPTEIWGYFNPPTKKCFVKQATSNLRTIQCINGLDRKTLRAKTPSDFALAFFEVNK
jgi:hypothetical protein